MNLHLVGSGLVLSSGGYIRRYIDFVSKHFSLEENIFVTLNMESSNEEWLKKPYYSAIIKEIPIRIPPRINNLIMTFFATKKLSNLAKEANKIIVHSLFSGYIYRWLFMNKRILDKTIWVLWGGDLYNYWLKEKHTLKEIINEKTKAAVIRQLGGIACLVEEDYMFAKSKYGTKATYYYAFYPNPIDFALLDTSITDYSSNSSYKKNMRILLGNSATETNKHFEVLEALAQMSEKDFEVICPLSYGDQQYVKKVIKAGEKMLGKRFTPLTEFCKPGDYAKILASVDTAIFNHNRQQGLGNILALLYLGKKVYIRNDVTSWKFLERHGIKVYNTKEFLQKPDSSIFDFDQEVAKRNGEIVAKEFSQERAAELWRKVFYE